MGKAFILGLGAQKCGTTWLHQLLSQDAHFAAGLMKEYHVWDALDIPVLYGNRTRPIHGNEARKIRHAMQNREGFYFEYFSSLLEGPATITADITPSYSGLSLWRLARIKAGFEQREIDCKTVFLIRDPVERDKSAVHFNLNRNSRSEGISPGTQDFCKALSQYYMSSHAKLRSSYHETITNIQNCFDPANVFIGIYESMFEPENVEKLCAFLRIGVPPGFSKIKYNETGGARPSCPDLELQMRSHYRDVYEFCFDTIPETRQVWSSVE